VINSSGPREMLPVRGGIGLGDNMALSMKLDKLL